MEKSPVRLRHHAKAVGGTYDCVKTDEVPAGEIWALEVIAYENETGARGTFRRYIEGHGYNHYLSELQGPGAAELIFSEKVVYLIPGERLTIRQATCTANDVLSLYCTGYMIRGPFLPNR